MELYPTIREKRTKTKSLAKNTMQSNEYDTLHGPLRSAKAPVRLEDVLCYNSNSNLRPKSSSDISNFKIVVKCYILLFNWWYNRYISNLS